MSPLNIAVLLRCENQEFQRAQAKAARDAGEKQGATVELFFAENSAFSQIQQVLALVKRPAELRPAAIVIELVGGAEGYRSTAVAALSAGIAWVEVSGLATSVPSLRSEFPDQFVMSVTTNEEDIGRIHAAQCRTLLPSGGSILYIEGPSLQPEVKARRLGLEEGLRTSRITIEKTLGGDWSDGSAEQVVAAFLARPNGFVPALICAQNDEMAIGARRAAVAQDSEWECLPYLGCDGLMGGGQKYVRERLLAASVVKPVTAGIAVTQVMQGLLGKGLPKDVSLSPESIPTINTLENLWGGGSRNSTRALRVSERVSSR